MIQQYRLYTAETKSQRPITTVSARNRLEAEATAEKRLNRPGLKRWYERWVEDGRIVIQRPS